MKQLKFIFCILMLANVLAGNAQNGKTTPEGSCPPGYITVITIDADVFNFHRPKYDCEKGFFICIRGVHFELDCQPATRLSSYLKDSRVHGYGLLLDRQIELHLPAALAEHPAYANDDMSVFFVEKDWIEIYSKDKKIGTMKEGDYEVKRTEEELIILVDLE
jgi:hypothetical protein